MITTLLLAAQLSTPVAACPAQAEVLVAAAEKVQARYVDPSQAALIAADLRKWAQDGRYAASCEDAARFLQRLNQDLDAHDGHFHVERTADAAKADDWLMQWRAAAAPTNAGIREVRVFEGNIGYLRLATFHAWDLAGAKLAHAWGLLKDTQGLILDLRQNGGGDADTPNRIVRSFLGDRVVAVQDIERRSGRTVDALPAASLPPYTGPVAILVDRRTASAAEFVAYSLQAEKRAVVVGARSAGAAHLMGEPIAIGQGMQITIPDGRPVNRRTGGNWERQGVVPEVPGGDDPLFLAREYLRREAAPPATEK
jgi:carboxyl-terminal processing protease